MKRISLLVVTLLLVMGTAQAQWLPRVAPEKAGFSSDRLERLHSMIQGYISEGKHAGAISVVAREGKLVDAQTYGFRDLEAKEPMTLDTIVRVYSMSKVVTSVAVMQLFEEGKLSLDDPVSRYVPELTHLKVCVGGTPEEPKLVDALRPVTIKHLLTHTAGFSYSFSAPAPVNRLYDKADILEAGSLHEFIGRLAKLPLVQQPGEAFHYGVNIDVLGYVVEVVSGKPLESYMQEKIFSPLGMKDTGFDVPEAKRGRVAKLYESGPDGKLREVAHPPYGTYAELGKGFPSGGGGLFSSAADYLRFAQMLLNGGKLDHQQVLGRKTVELMTTNNLTFLGTGRLPGSGSQGFGLGGRVRLDVAKENQLGSVGQFGWDGAATTTFTIDPHENAVALLLVQHLPYNQHGIFDKFYRLFYASLVD